MITTSPDPRGETDMAFQIGKNFHIIHMTDDLRDLDTWYYDVFSVRRFMPESYMPAEKRDASLVILGELCVEDRGLRRIERACNRGWPHHHRPLASIRSSDRGRTIIVRRRGRARAPRTPSPRARAASPTDLHACRAEREDCGA